MGANLKIPVQFRKLTDDTAELQCSGPTVSACLDELVDRYPDVRSRLFENGGEVRKYISIFVNGKNVRTMSGTDTEVNDGDQISLLATIGGGEV